MATVTYPQLLRTNSRYRNLWFGQVVSELGTWFNFIAELGLVRALSGTALSASLIVAFHFFPYCLLGPVAGALADRVPRRAMMIAADAARAVAALGFLLVTTPERLWIAYLCAAAISSLSAFFDAAKNAAMPNLARGPELLPATSLMHATRFLQMTVGAMLGGLASEAFGYRTAFALNALSFVISAGFILRIPGYVLEADDRAERLAASVRGLMTDLGEALRFIQSRPLVLAIFALNIGWALGGGMSQVVADRFGGRVFAAPGTNGDTGVALLNAAAGVGLCLGMVLARRVGAWVEARDRVGIFMGWTIALSGLVFAVSGFMPNIWLMAAMLALGRTILSAEYAVQDTVLLVAIPDHLRGKVYTIDRAAELGTMAISALLAGALFSVLDPRVVPVIAGALQGVPGVIWLLALARGRFHVGRDALGTAEVVSGQ